MKFCFTKNEACMVGSADKTRDRFTNQSNRIMFSVRLAKTLDFVLVGRNCLYAHKRESESCSVVSNSLQPHGLYSPWNSPGQNTGAVSCSLQQGVFPTQGSSPGFLHCMQILYQQICGWTWCFRQLRDTTFSVLRVLYVFLLFYFFYLGVGRTGWKKRGGEREETLLYLWANLRIW